MHTTEPQVNNVPAFLIKLWKIVDDENYNDLICWSPGGKSFIIRNQARFSKELLPLYFKHSNMASFIRQLNMYGFRKMTNIENSGLRSDRDDMEFYHQYFVRGHEAALENIKRKTPMKTSLQVSNSKNGDHLLKNEDMHEILSEIESVRGKQENVDSILTTVQRENEALWREVAILRQKHHKQQQIVEKLIQFLLSLVGNRGLVGVKRKAQLMINGTEENNPVKIRRASRGTLNNDNNNGPVIHDITDAGELDEDLVSSASPIITNVNINDMSPGQVLIDDSSNHNFVENFPVVPDTMEPLSLLDPLQTAVSLSGAGELGCSSLTNDGSTKKDGGNKKANKNNASPLNTPPASPSDLINKDKASQQQATSKDLVALEQPTLSNFSNHDHSFRQTFNTHVDGIESELDWLQQQLQTGGLNIDPDTLLGVGLSEDHSWFKQLFTSDDPTMSNLGTKFAGNNVIGNELIQYMPSTFSSNNELDLESLNTPTNPDINLILPDFGNESGIA